MLGIRATLETNYLQHTGFFDRLVLLPAKDTSLRL
jgi:hypothetical protein